MIATPGGTFSLKLLLADPDRHLIKEMDSQLPTSPLFRNGISLSELQDAFKSLDELFFSLSGVSNAVIKEPSIGSPTRNGSLTMATIRRETWTY